MCEATQRNPPAAMDTTSKVAAAQHTTANFLLAVLVDRCRRCTWNVCMDLRDAAAAQHGKVRGVIVRGLRGAAIIIVVLCSLTYCFEMEWNCCVQLQSCVLFEASPARNASDLTLAINLAPARESRVSQLWRASSLSSGGRGAAIGRATPERGWLTNAAKLTSQVRARAHGCFRDCGGSIFDFTKEKRREGEKRRKGTRRFCWLLWNHKQNAQPWLKAGV